MTCRGHVRNGVVILDDPTVLLEGVEVEVMVRHNDIGVGHPGAADIEEPPHPSIEHEIAGIVADVPESQWDRLPADLNEQLDHYIYGTLKR